MNKKIMVIWFILMVSIFGFILFRGYSQRDTTYLNLESSLENATRKYILGNRIKVKLFDSKTVFIEELLEEDYIKNEDMELIDNYCIKSIVYTKGLFSDDYSIKMDCESKE